MKNKLNFAVTCRALIIDQGELLMVRHDPKFNYLALPGGRLEVGEHVTDTMSRELIEETAIAPDVGKLLIVNDWIGTDIQRIEFFFWIKNGADYRHSDTTAATHGYEIAELLFGNPADPKFNLLPSFLRQKFSRIAQLGEDYPTELIRSFSEKK